MLAQLLLEARVLPRVSGAAARSYQDKAQAMEKWVNAEMGRYPGISRIIGYNPLSLMEANHHSHARFMANVFRFNAFDLLAKVTLWVYRTYHAHGFTFEYFLLELSAWQRAVAAHLEFPQSQAILAIYQWMLDRHQSFMDLSQLPADEHMPLNPAWQTTRDAFLQALLSGDAKKCRKIGEDLATTKNGLQNLYLEIMQPCMYEVGILWEQGKISVAQEHLASNIVSRLMAVLHPSIEMAHPFRGRAIVTSAPNEYHEMGGRCVADFLTLDGWQVDFLGANTPQEELIDFLLSSKPDLLAISVTMPFNLDLTQDLITAARKPHEISTIKIMVGGQAFNMIPELWKITGADGYAPDALKAVELAEKW